MKKILIPTDFSKNAWNAVTYAADIFKDHECTFYLLNAYKITVHSRSELTMTDPETLTFQKGKIKSEDGLAKLVEMLDSRDQNKKHSYFVISVLDDPISALRIIIEKKDIQLVVMGTKGSSNKGNKLLGSNTVNAMETLRSSPILGVPLDARVVDVKEIVFPTSFKTHYKRRELVHLVELAQLQGANICVVHVSNDQELKKGQQENKKLLEDCLEGASYSFHNLGGTDITSIVTTFVESRNSDIIAFINRKHSFFDNLFNTPMVKELGMFSKVPLLVMHDSRS